jgi:hypothetical protein
MNSLSKLFGRENNEKWCDMMGYFNPYIDPFENHLSDRMDTGDRKCFERYPEHNFVYDKLWVAQSQNLPSGKLENLKGKEHTVSYPIFIKPRWGHLSASSRNCFKINKAEELGQYAAFGDMMWSSYLDGKEGMTDFVLLKGNIVHQITYVYSDTQNGFTDVWKLVSPYSKPPVEITEWVNRYMHGFTGIVNIQHRVGNIIEVSLRLARGGSYIIATDNEALIDNINNIFHNNFWDFSLQQKMNFKPYYVFKCFTTLPIVYLPPQKFIDFAVRRRTDRPLYEYYFEPAGNDGTVFFQFMHDDLEEGLKIKKDFELGFNIMQIIAFILLVCLITVPFFQFGYKYVAMGIIALILLTRFLNPFHSNRKVFAVQLQRLFLTGTSTAPDPEDD